MASRREQKDAARERRLAEEQAAQAKVQRTRRLQILGGVIAIAVVVVVVLVVVSSGSSPHKVAAATDTKATTSASESVSKLLKGIPQSGNTLGNPKAKITFTEYGDLECPICQEFSTSSEEQLISNEVRSGKVKLVYKSFETASSDPDAAHDAWNLQQTAAYAAGAQNKAWNYILLFYRRQQPENTPYVTASFLTSLAKAIPGLAVKTWNTDRFNPTYANQVITENKHASSMPFQGQAGTPALIASSGSKQTEAISGLLSYQQVQKLIAQVS